MFLLTVNQVQVIRNSVKFELEEIRILRQQMYHETFEKYHHHANVQHKQQPHGQLYPLF